MIILTARMCSGLARKVTVSAAKSGVTVLIRDGPGGSGRHDGKLIRYCIDRF
ncbi:hypothetical protein [Bacillus amyloliquefaciens]|uniref:hypothetical protein n=1 Tax=Bacillus amyloliquefaciens TaxID=1390 RepID=UPI0020C63DBE|nr:hypothetical protein [Bacillus amyloliquefaciens]